LHQQIEEIGNLWDISSIAYDMQITFFKSSIINKEMAYETTLEQWQGQIQMTRNKLAKAKEDLKYYREQIPMFHKKIVEVQAIIFQKKQLEREASLVITKFNW